MRVGSLCSGYGGLDMALGGDVRWVCDNDKGAARILAHHYPDVPNHGDLVAFDWTRAEPVDVITVGFPCQPHSTAGKRKATADERWIWDGIADCIRVVRPAAVLLENVRGLLSSGGGHAMGRVLRDLSDLGYVGRWGLVAASNVGAPHRRERVFIVARPPDDAAGSRRHEGVAERGDGSATAGQGAAGLPDRPGPHRAAAVIALLPTPKASDGPKGGPGMRNGRGVADALPGAIALLKTPTAQLGINGGSQRDGGHGPTLADQVEHLLPTPVVNGMTRVSSGGTSGQPRQKSKDGRRAVHGPSLSIEVRRDGQRFGRYAAAIARWERVLGRPAPDPVEVSPKGSPRLSPRFVEWMMGLPAGWVTGVSGLSYAAQLKALGNGVVPQQAAYAVSVLAPWLAVAA